MLLIDALMRSTWSSHRCSNAIFSFGHCSLHFAIGFGTDAMERRKYLCLCLFIKQLISFDSSLPWRCLTPRCLRLRLPMLVLAQSISSVSPITTDACCSSTPASRWGCWPTPSPALFKTQPLVARSLHVTSHRGRRVGQTSTRLSGT
jgi:hypothetical protein